MPEDELIQRISRAVAELAKGLKSVTFYPPGHPVLIQGLSKTIANFEEIPLPEAGLEIDVTRNALLYMETPLPVPNKAVADLNRELYLRRAAKVIFLPNLKADEMVTFLAILNRDLQEIQDEGGLERIMLREKVSRIWVNRVDYQGLTEMLKTEEPESGESAETATAEDDLSLGLENLPPEELTIDGLLGLIEKETDAAAYRDHLIALSRALFNERMDRKIEYTSRALMIFAGHVERPPLQNAEIANLARLGIKEMASDELVAHYLHLLRDKAGRARREVETVLVAFGDRAVKPLLKALAEEEDLLVRKSIVEIIVKIGRPAVPALLENLNDARWFMVRNLVTILGSLGLPDLAPHQPPGVVAHLQGPLRRRLLRGGERLEQREPPDRRPRARPGLLLERRRRAAPQHGLVLLVPHHGELHRRVCRGQGRVRQSHRFGRADSIRSPVALLRDGRLLVLDDRPPAGAVT